MVQKDGSIVLSDWQKGMGDNPVLGNETIQNMDIFDEVGVLKIGSRAVEESLYFNTIVDSGFDGVPVADVTSEAGIRTSLSSDGYLFHDDSVLSSGLVQGWDLCVWNDTFVIVSYSSTSQGRIGIIDRTSGSGVWNANKIIGLDSTHNIKLLKAQDGYVYFTAGRYIGRITNLSSLAGVVTVTYSSNVLDLPEQIYATTLAELGSDLIIGTQKGSTFASRIDYNFANLYTWDRTSASFRLPMQVNENSIMAMVQKNNQIYFSAGTRGNIYVTDGTNFQLIKQLPFSRIKRDGPTSQVYYNAMSFNQQGNLLVGTSNTAGVSANNYLRHGVWEIALTQGYPCHLAYTALSQSVGRTEAVEIGFIWAGSDSTMHFGTRTNLIVPKILGTQSIKNDGYTCLYESQKYIVGTRVNRKSYQTIDFLLSEPLVSGQGLRFSYRKNEQSSYTVIGTFTYADLGSVVSHYAKALIADAELLQIRIELEQDSGTAFPSNVKLIKATIN